jgi:hypothetical protein
MVDVHIKNIPLSYLKGQQSGFFESDLFNDAVEVFDKYKKPVTSDNDAQSLEEAIQPTEMLLDILVGKYSGEEYIPVTQSDKEDYIFIGMTGKATKKTLFSPRKYITRCASEILPIDNCFFTLYNANTLYNSTKAHSNTPALDINNSILKSLSKPEDTSNTISDIVNKAKFYERIDTFKVYDDVLYKEDLLNRLYNIELILTKLTLPAAVLKRRVDSFYPTMLKNEAKACEQLVTDLIEKYKNVFAKDYTSVDEIPVSTKVSNYTKVIESILASKLKSLPVSVYLGTCLNTGTNTITHGMNKTDYRVMVINSTSGLEVTSQCTIATVDANSISVKFNGSATPAFNMTVCLLFSNRSLLHVKQSSLASFQEESDKVILFKFNKGIIGNKCSIDIQSFNTLYGFYEVRSDNIIVKPTAVVANADSIEFTFAPTVVGKVDVFIMPNNHILRGVSKVKIVASKVLSIIAATNLFDKRISIWRDIT